MAEERNGGNRPPAFLNYDIAPSTSRTLSQDVPLDLSCRPGKSAEAPNQPQENPADDKLSACSYCVEQFTCPAYLENHKDSNIIHGIHRCPTCERARTAEKETHLPLPMSSSRACDDAVPSMRRAGMEAAAFAGNNVR
ncbi:hypothetical protein HPB52_006415 [Rhipicephalus sanguineus]|uniref:Uncharacterized protein n=1 Tax=Rhipicephalus sanguineus TaxID=34632 RepID=A0A9D4PD10_RHISA|nr:hypothetical protein HPB52_006415 [Rhipicephalus sanguineus]